MELREIICPSCGAKIHVSGHPEYVTCEYCDSQIVTGFKPQTEHQTNTSHSGRTADTQSHKNTYQKTRDQQRPTPDGLSGMFSLTDPVNRWRCLGFLWILIVVVLMWIITITESGDLAIFWALWVIIGGIILLVFRNTSGRASMRNFGPPLYARWGFIIIIGLFSLGIYWVIGAFLRWWWKYKNQY